MTTTVKDFVSKERLAVLKEIAVFAFDRGENSVADDVLGIMKKLESLRDSNGDDIVAAVLPDEFSNLKNRSGEFDLPIDQITFETMIVAAALISTKFEFEAKD